MKQFSVVLHELRIWLTSFSWINKLMPFRLYFLFGGLGLSLLEGLFYRSFTYSSLNLLYLFNTLPLSALATYGFLFGAWLTLASRDLKLLPYGLWGKAVVMLISFSGFGLNSLIGVAIYGLLGFLLFRYTVSSYASETDSSSHSM